MATPLRTLLHALRLTGLAYADALLDLWAAPDPALKDAARFLEAKQHTVALAEQCRMLLGRLALFPPRQRPRYPGTLKLGILRYAERHGVGPAELAGEFAISRSTVYRWRRLRQAAAPAATSIGSQTVPAPPLRRIADSVRDFVRLTDVAGFPGTGSIAGALCHMRVRVSVRSVGRFRKERVLVSPAAVALVRQPALPPRKAASDDPRPAGEEAPTASRPGHERPRAARLARAFVQARDTLRSHLGSAVARLRRRLPAQRQHQVDGFAQLRSRRAQQLHILHARLARVEAHARPHYTPELRAAILAFKYRYRLSHGQTGRRFLIDAGTVCSWNVRVDHDPTGLVQPNPSLRSARHAIERAVAAIGRLREDLGARLLQALTTLCERIPLRKRRHCGAPQGRSSAERAANERRAPIRARYPNHFWMADLTLFTPARSDLYLASLIDVYSRRTLGWKLYLEQPSADDVAGLLRAAVAAHGKPRHVVSDRGGQFTGEAFQRELQQIGADHRVGAVGESGSIAIIERFWLTVKQALDIHNCPPLIPDVFAERIDRVIRWYDHLRPHQSLGAATPAEVFSGVASPAWDALPAPRGRLGEASERLGLRIRFALDGERRLPYLEPVV